MAAEVVPFAPARCAVVANGRSVVVLSDEEADDLAAAVAGQLAPGEVRRRVEAAALGAALNAPGPRGLAAGRAAAYDAMLAILDEELRRAAVARRRRAS